MASRSFLLLALGLACACTAHAAAELKIITLKEAPNCDVKAEDGKRVSAHYIGTLEKDGSKFDASYDRGRPFQFVLGKGQVIKGWDQGIKGMCVGEKRKLIVPAELGYGARGAAGGKIPPGATLVFEVELMGVE